MILGHHAASRAVAVVSVPGNRFFAGGASIDSQ